MDRRGSKRVEIGGLDDKRQITAVFAASLIGDFLPVQLVYQGKTDACHPLLRFPPEWDITHTPNHWSNEDTMERYLENIIVPYVMKKREELKLAKDFPALMIFDCFKGQVTEGFLEKLEQHNLHHVIVPANCTDRLQPLDVSVNKAVKDHLKKQFQLWYSEHINEQLDQGTTVESLTPVDMRMNIMKPLELNGLWPPLIISKRTLPSSTDSRRLE